MTPSPKENFLRPGQTMIRYEILNLVQKLCSKFTDVGLVLPGPELILFWGKFNFPLHEIYALPPWNFSTELISIYVKWTRLPTFKCQDISMMTMAKSPCSMSVADAKHPLQRLLADASSSEETSLFMDSFPPTARGICMWTYSCVGSREHNILTDYLKWSLAVC